MGVIITVITPVLDRSVRKLCVQPYPGHPRGCPNYNKKEGCPPLVQTFDEFYDMEQPFYAIVNEFDFKAHTDRMRALHPLWSARQVRCCLYWQPKARAALNGGIRQFLESRAVHDEHQGYSVTASPEAMGVNVAQTLAHAGIPLEWPVQAVARQVAIAGVRKFQP
jgi:predicted metal-binding protein